MTSTSAPVDEPQLRRRYSTRTILTAVAIGAAVGVVLIPLNFAQGAVNSSMPLLAVVFYGIWGMSSLIPLALQQRGGVGVIGATAAGVVSSISPYGLAMVVMMLLWGVLMEASFTLTRYRWFGLRMFLVTGLVTGLVSSAMTVAQLNLMSMGPVMVAAVCAVQTVSFIVCAWLSWVIAGALRRAGISGGRRA